jgi:uncharacterized membrane protein
MKKIIIFAMLLILSATSFSQQPKPSKPVTRADFLKKSKNQKTGALVLLIGGSALVVTGILLSNQASFDNLGTTAAIAMVGGVAVLGSIPLFLASGRNKRKGMSINAFFKLENAPVIHGYSMAHTSYPAVSIKIKLR